MAVTIPVVSVVVCTYNRSRSLQETLGALRAQRAAGFDYEVVVVDNNSTDDTRPVAAALHTQWDGRLRYVFEGRQGQSYARNAGVAAAHGDVVAFTDDDVEPQPDWLAALQKAFCAYGADCVYGKVLPRWQAPPPAWLGTYFLNRLAIVDCGEEPFIATPVSLATPGHRQLAGANFAVRKDLLSRLGGFDVRLGNRGARVGGEEDTELFERLLASGARIVYTPDAVVHHKVQAERLRLSYFRRWHFDHGVTEAHVTACEPGRGVLGIPFWAIRQMVEHGLRYLASLGSSAVERRLMHQMRVVYGLGLVSGKLRMALRRGHGGNGSDAT